MNTHHNITIMSKTIVRRRFITSLDRRPLVILFLFTSVVRRRHYRYHYFSRVVLLKQIRVNNTHYTHTYTQTRTLSSSVEEDVYPDEHYTYDCRRLLGAVKSRPMPTPQRFSHSPGPNIMARINSALSRETFS